MGGEVVNEVSRNIVLVIAMLFATTACNREERRFESTPGDDLQPTQITMNSLVSGQSTNELRERQRKEYEHNAYHIGEGKRLFNWFNCSGCHAHGGGDSGPPLMDERWIYGGEIDQIYMSIAQGRPNGMPAFVAKLTPQQIWQLSAYIRSMGGYPPKSARPSRDDHMQFPSEQSRKDEPIIPAPHASADEG